MSRADRGSFLVVQALVAELPQRLQDSVAGMVLVHELHHRLVDEIREQHRDS